MFSTKDIQWWFICDCISDFSTSLIHTPAHCSYCCSFALAKNLENIFTCWCYSANYHNIPQAKPDSQTWNCLALLSWITRHANTLLQIHAGMNIHLMCTYSIVLSGLIYERSLVNIYKHSPKCAGLKVFWCSLLPMALTLVHYVNPFIRILGCNHVTKTPSNNQVCNKL